MAQEGRRRRDPRQAARPAARPARQWKRSSSGRTRHFGDTTLEGTPFTFAAYKLAPSRRRSTGVQVQGAYCESFFGATSRSTSSTTAEERGPRWRRDDLGRYSGRRTRGNLLPSCTDCKPAPATDAAGRDDADFGKANQFPIASDERARRRTRRRARRGFSSTLARSPESPLLFEPKGRQLEDAQGEGVDPAFALLRRGWCRRVRAFSRDPNAHLDRARPRAQARGGRARRRPRGALAREMQALARFVATEHEYSATAKALIEPVLEELTG